MFSCELGKISENTFFTEHLSATAFVLRAALKIVEKRKLNFGSFLTLVILRLTESTLLTFKLFHWNKIQEEKQVNCMLNVKKVNKVFFFFFYNNIVHKERETK